MRCLRAGCEFPKGQRRSPLWFDLNHETNHKVHSPSERWLLSSVKLSGVFFGPLDIFPGFWCLITMFQQVRRLIERGFQQVPQLPVEPHHLAVRMAALMVFQEAFMKANIRKEQGRQNGAVGDIAARR
jgi:hypothetical protein